MKNESCAICAERVQLPPRGWKPGDVLYCETHAVLADVDPLVHGPRDLDRAIFELNRDPSCLVEWPWRSLNDMAGPIAPGTVTYVAAFPKNGKTSFLSDCIDHWWNLGKRVFVVPLEQRKDELYTRLACLRIGIDPDYALSKRLHLAAKGGDYQARIEREELEAEFRRWKADPDLLDRLWLQGAPVVTGAVLRLAMRQAREAHADVVLVDHVDHVQAAADSHQSEIQVSVQAQMIALECAQQLDLAVVLATQLNRKAAGNDPSAAFRPPQIDWLWMPGKKQQVATRILGLYRPQRPDITEDDRLAVRAGFRSARDLVLPGRMGIVDMASRYSGSQIHGMVQLAYHSGRLFELSDLELKADAAAAQAAIEGQKIRYRHGEDARLRDREAIKHGINTDRSPSKYIGASELPFSDKRTMA